jgi:hypothetical protein
MMEECCRCGIHRETASFRFPAAFASPCHDSDEYEPRFVNVFSRETHGHVPDRAILEFFRQPVIAYSRRLRANLDRDPEYIERNKSEVYRELRSFLTRAGCVFDEQNIDLQMEYVVREVVGRLRSYEKGDVRDGT